MSDTTDQVIPAASASPATAAAAPEVAGVGNSGGAGGLGELRLTPGTGARRRFLADRSAVAGAAIVAVLLLLAIFGPALAPKNPIAINPDGILLGPRHSAWFGTDNLGRDIFSRVIAGARTSIVLALIIGFLMAAIGVIVGTVAGYVGGWVDSALMRMVDVFLAFPSLVLALAIAGARGAGDASLVLALIVTNWPNYARLLRGSVLAEREREYVDAGRGVGARPRRIMLRHVLPNAISPILVLLSFDLGTIVLYIASLGYLGVGVPPPKPEWGTMIAGGRTFVLTGPQTIIFPGLAVALTVIGFNLLGDGLRNALDPRHELPVRRGFVRRTVRRVAGLVGTRSGPRSSSASRDLGPVAQADPTPDPAGPVGSLGPVGPVGPVARPTRAPNADGAGAAQTSTPPSTPGDSGVAAPVLQVEGVQVRITHREEQFEPVRDVAFSLAAGETLGLVGESGCGKTMTALAALGLLPPRAKLTGGRVRLSGREIQAMPEAELRQVRGREIAMVFQDPLTSLNPTMAIGNQVADPIRFHLGLSKAQARERATEMLNVVGLPRPAECLGLYPHQLSGGQRQRVMIAMALACEPSVLIADEPTTALDVSIQDQILGLLEELRARTGMGLLLITHDMGVISRMADRVAVMYAGRIVEEAATADLFTRPRHRYTEALLESVPRPDQDRSRPLYSIPGRPPELRGGWASCPFSLRCRFAGDDCRAVDPPLEGHGHRFACFHPADAAGFGASAAPTASASPQAAVPLAASAPATDDPGSDVRVDKLMCTQQVVDPKAAAQGMTGSSLLVVDALVKTFRSRARTGWVQAVSGVSFTVARGETFALVGESGCGKTTLGRLVTALERPNSGSALLDGQNVAALSGAALRRARRHFQLIFQDPFGSLDPRVKVGSALLEPMTVHRIGTPASRTSRVRQLLDEVGLEERVLDRYPHELSGGQRQRVGFARALTVNPQLLVADEPVSALDVSIRSQILNLMRRLQVDHQLTYILISHDLSVVRYLADRVGVMYLGKLVELGPSDAVYRRPLHPYTAGLLAAIPVPDPAKERRRRTAAVVGEPPSPTHPPSGCRFRTRCPLAQAVCAEQEPPLQPPGPGWHPVACHFPLVAQADGGGSVSLTAGA